MLHFQPFVRIYVVRKMESHDFDILLTRLKDRMYRFAYTLLRQSADAEDAVQDVVERLWRYRRRIDPDRNADSLFMTSVRNACLDRLRQKTSNPIDRRELAAIDQASPDDFEIRESVRAAIAQLPPRQREMIHLRDIEGYPIPEIAALTQTDEANVRMTLSRARHKLKQIIEQSTEYGKTY